MQEFLTGVSIKLFLFPMAGDLCYGNGK